MSLQEDTEKRLITLQNNVQELYDSMQLFNSGIFTRNLMVNQRLLIDAPNKDTALTITGRIRTEGKIVAGSSPNLHEEMKAAVADLLNTDEVFAKSIRGVQGDQGKQGEQGDQGAEGDQGPKGADGPRGPDGPEGPRGRNC